MIDSNIIMMMTLVICLRDQMHYDNCHHLLSSVSFHEAVYVGT